MTIYTPAPRENGIELAPDCDGQEQTVTATLSATPWLVLNPRLAVPDWATRAIITAPAGLTRYRLNGDPGAAPSGAASAGATMQASTTRVVGLAAGTGRTLGLSSAVAGGVVTVEWLP
jgi:hypothetical protein